MLSSISEALQKQDAKIALFTPLSKDNHQIPPTATNTCAEKHVGAILNLPDEILMHIFSYVRGDHEIPRRYGQPLEIRDIKNVRLTCKKFIGASSHLLTPTLGLAVDNESLDMIDYFSSHPGISKGVKSVDISLRFYHPELARNIYKFAKRRVEDLQAFIDRWEDQESLYPRYGEDPEVQKKTWNAVMVLRQIFASWEAVTSASPGDTTVSGKFHLLRGIAEDSTKYLIILKAAHKYYQRRWKEQEELLREGKFIEDIANAFSRLPMARRLELHDLAVPCRHRKSSDRWTKPWIAGATDHAELVRDLVQPMSMLNMEDHGLRSYSEYLFRFPVTLPIAIHEVGTWLTEVKVYTSTQHCSELFFEPDEKTKLQAALKKLRHFRFGPATDFEDCEQTTLELVDLRDYLTTVIDADSLETLHLDFDAICSWSYSSSAMDIGSLISFRSWPRLRSLSTRIMSMGLSHLTKFIEQHKDLPYLFLNHTNLITGTWAEALDLLRMHAKDDWHIYGARGAGLSFDMEAKIFIESSLGGAAHANPAEHYIHGVIDENPVG